MRPSALRRVCDAEGRPVPRWGSFLALMPKLQQRSQAGIGRRASNLRVRASQHAIFADQRDYVGNGGDGGHLQEQSIAAPAFDCSQPLLASIASTSSQRKRPAPPRYSRDIPIEPVLIEKRRLRGGAVFFGHVMVGDDGRRSKASWRDGPQPEARMPVSTLTISFTP